MFKLSKLSADGTHAVGEIVASYAKLVKAFGKPQESDGYKVSGEWTFEDGRNGNIFTLYDWKETSLYDSEYPSVESFRQQKSANFHIGGDSDPTEFKAWMEKELNKD